jgi:hypothetical protein
MEIRKSNSVVSTVTQESTSSESAKSVKGKSNGIASAKDSFEVSSSSNQENSGTKNLSTAQQQEASKFNYKDPGNNGSTSQNSRSTYEDAKNSGLSSRLGHSKEQSEADSKKQLPNGVTVGDLKNSAGQAEQSNVAVKDAQQKLNDGGRTNYRESLDQELARRRQDVTMMGGSSALDRTYSAPDPTATPKGKGEVATGADAVAYSEQSERKNKDGSVTQIITEKTSNENGTTERQTEFTFRKDRTILTEDKETNYYNDNSKDERDTKNFYDAHGNLTKTISTDNAYADGKLVRSSTSTTTNNKDGSSTNTTTTKETQPNGSTKTTTETTTTPPSYGYDGTQGGPVGYTPLPPGVDDDRATGEIPDLIRNQINQTKPKRGGETELTDGGVTGNSADGSGPVNNAFTRTGGVMGAVAQPTRAGEYVGGPSNGTVGSAVQNGGATDSLDGSSWTGTTHQDDPGDVQFGPAEQPKEQASTKKSEDSNSSVLDQISNRKSKKAE